MFFEFLLFIQLDYWRPCLASFMYGWRFWARATKFSETLMTREKVEKVASFSESNKINRRRFLVRTLGDVIRMEILFNLSLMTEGSRAPSGCLLRTSLYWNFHNFSWQKISKEIFPRKTCAASSSQDAFCRFIRLEKKNKKFAPDLVLLSVSVPSTDIKERSPNEVKQRCCL